MKQRAGWGQIIFLRAAIGAGGGHDYESKVYERLEFDKVKRLWSDCALTGFAKRAIEEMRPILSETELAAKLRETAEAREMLEQCGTPPLVSLEGIRELFAAAGKGLCLTPAQLEKIGMALTAVGRMKEYLCRGKSQGIPLAYYEENLDPLDPLRERLRFQIWNEQVADGASKLLKGLRGDIMRTEDRMREKAEGIMRSNKECMSDSFTTVRSGHVCVPVKKEYKFRIGGIVMDKSSTGSTFFIEPAAVGKYYQELQELRMDEENEVKRILYELTALAAECGEEMEGNLKMLEKLDFVFSKGKLSMSYEGKAPRITSQRRIRLWDARHPLMDRQTCVPLQFSIGDGINGIVITGPNAGGKTVALKTVALTCMMAQCGLHVPCGEAEICMNGSFLCDIGDGQSLSENLSTFSAHIANVLDILRRVNRESLVVLDELGSGTDPAEGMGIAVAVLEELKKSGALFLATTHYPQVKAYAAGQEGIVNARMTFDKENLQPLYQMVIGEAGESCAFYIAGRLGMPRSMLRRAAQAAYGAAGGEAGGGTAGAGGGIGSGRAGSRDPEMGCEGRQTYEERQELFQGMQLQEELKREPSPHIVRSSPKAAAKNKQIPFRRGDSVMIYPDKRIGIVCGPANDKGVLRVQLPGKKIWINHKRVKLLVAAQELYPENYDFSIVFDTVENRKLRHQIERKYVEGLEIAEEPDTVEGR